MARKPLLGWWRGVLRLVAVPLTLPTHPLAVVPLKIWRPRWFDGVALVVGAVAPDIPYAIDGYGFVIRGHAWHAVLWWSVPLTLLAAALIRWSAPVVAAHLPGGDRDGAGWLGFGGLALRDYGVLGTVRHRWWVSAGSAIIGAGSHLLWDLFTHPHYLESGWIRTEPVAGWPWWMIMVRLSDLVGLVAGVALVIWLGRTGALRRWHGPPPPVEAQTARFWSAFAAVVGVGAVVLPLQPAQYPPQQAIRVLLIGCLALLAGAGAASVGTGRRGSRRPGDSAEARVAAGTSGQG